jgi:hypothetical protein
MSTESETSAATLCCLLMHAAAPRHAVGSAPGPPVLGLGLRGVMVHGAGAQMHGQASRCSSTVRSSTPLRPGNQPATARISVSSARMHAAMACAPSEALQPVGIAAAPQEQPAGPVQLPPASGHQLHRFHPLHTALLCCYCYGTTLPLLLPPLLHYKLRAAASRCPPAPAVYHLPAPPMALTMYCWWYSSASYHGCSGSSVVASLTPYLASMPAIMA